MRDKHRWKIIILTGIIISSFSGGFILIDLYLGIPIYLPENSQYARIIEVEHPESMEVSTPFSINITYTFGDSDNNLIITSNQNVLARKVEIVFWRELPGIVFHIYFETLIQYNISFSRTGSWTIIINQNYTSQVVVVERRIFIDYNFSYIVV